MGKFKRLQKRDYQLLEQLYKHKYLDFNYIWKNIYPSIKVRRVLLRKLRELKNEGLIVNFINSSVTYKEIDPVIYSLTEIGYSLVYYKYDYYNFDEQASLRLKQGFEHNLVMIHILSNYAMLDSGARIFNEKESFQKLGEKKHEVVRPDGAVINGNNNLIIFEYEHSNLKRDLFIKLSRYNDFFSKGLYRFNYSFGEYSIKNAVLHLVTSKPLSIIALERIQSLDLTFLITNCTAQEMLDQPLNPDNYRIIYKPKVT